MSEPEQAIPHYHKGVQGGRVQHEHPDGDVPHTHAEPPGRPRFVEHTGWRAVPVGVAAGISIFVAIVGLLVWAGTDSNANACHNPLVGVLATKQCTSWVFWHDVGTAALWIGVLATVVIFVLAAIKDKSPGTRQVLTE